MNGNTMPEKEPRWQSVFRLVAATDYPKLKAVLNSRLPHSVMVHNAIKLAISGTSEMDFYTYQGRLDDRAIIMGVCYVKDKVEDEGFLVACLSAMHPTNLDEVSASAFVEHLQPSSQASWRPMMLNIMRDSTPIITKALLDRGSTVTINPCQDHVYPLDKMDSNNTSLADLHPPRGLIIKPLEPCHAKVVASHWSYGILTAGGAEATTRSYIERNPSVGVFSVVDDELLSWGTCYDFGKVAMLFTPAEHRGRGYATWVLRGMVIEMAKRGLLPTAAANVRNIASRNSIVNAGFVKSGHLDFIFAE